MTIAEIRQSKKTVLTPNDVYELLSCRRYDINLQARNDPKKLGFPVIIVRSRVKIPREAFLCYWDGKEHSATKEMPN